MQSQRPNRTRWTRGDTERRPMPEVLVFQSTIDVREKGMPRATVSTVQANQIAGRMLSEVQRKAHDKTISWPMHTRQGIL